MEKRECHRCHKIEVGAVNGYGRWMCSWCWYAINGFKVTR